MPINQESQELQEARRILALFDKQPFKPEGVSKLADALFALSDLRDLSDNEHERNVARNLFDTYARKAEENAGHLLSDFDSIPDEDVEHWLTVMKEFEHF